MPQFNRFNVGQLFVVGFNKPEIDQDITALIRDYGVGTVILFRRNMQSPEQLQKLCHDLQKMAKEAGHKHPLLFSIDQENGLVPRLASPLAAQLPGGMTLGATGSLERARECANVTGEILQFYGININYAPVGDVNSEPRNPVISIRSPGDNPQKVSQFASAAARGLREKNVIPCIKHFPGHGDTTVDSHFGLPVVNKTKSDLENLEFIPFRDAAAQDIEMVMTAHISLPQITGSNVPATLSPEVLNILRTEMGYNGVVVTDCLEMDGVKTTYGTVEGSLMALQAGVDCPMVSHTFERQSAAIDRVTKAVNSGELAIERLNESLDRLEKLKLRFTSWETALTMQPSDKIAAINESGRKLAQQVYVESCSVVRSKDKVFPISMTAKTVLVYPNTKTEVGTYGILGGQVPSKSPFSPDVPGEFVDILRLKNPSLHTVTFDKNSSLSEEDWKLVDNADIVIFASRNAIRQQYQREVGLQLSKRCGSKLVTIATCAPYDFLQDSEIVTYITMYEPTPEAFQGVVSVMYGETLA
ncbi:hypothetical protein Golomagni_07017, partial [Golovinomyces magnicellulatus]